MVLSLIRAISQSSQQPSPSRIGESSPQPQRDEARDPSRELILTLHVLFPNLVLPALDLLDRQLVEKIQVASGENSSANLDQPPRRADSRARVEQPHRRVAPRPSVYCVRSLPLTASSRAATCGPRDRREGSRSHTVHLGVWNCSCAAFALDKYSGPTSNHRVCHVTAELPLMVAHASLDEASGSRAGFPMCKHLLASLLVDDGAEWGALKCVERAVSKCEMAALMSTV